MTLGEEPTMLTFEYTKIQLWLDVSYCFEFTSSKERKVNKKGIGADTTSLKKNSSSHECLLVIMLLLNDMCTTSIF